MPCWKSPTVFTIDPPSMAKPAEEAAATAVIGAQLLRSLCAVDAPLSVALVSSVTSERTFLITPEFSSSHLIFSTSSLLLGVGTVELFFLYFPL